MKLLIIGCGSIGRRHARNASSIGAEIILCDINNTLANSIAAELGDVPCFTDYMDAVEKVKPDAAVIASPSHLHLTQAAQLAQKKINMMIEKPLSHSKDGITEVLQLVRKNKVTAMMGQSFRFHEGFLRLKELLEEQTIGKTYHVYTSSGWYLPDWHIHEDYRKEYAARGDMGGGVALTNLSHFFDLFSWLFGEIREIIGWKTKLSNLDIDVEDSAFCILKTYQGVIVNCISDFLGRLPRNDFKIIGSEGHIEADFTSHVIRVWRTIEKRYPPGKHGNIDNKNMMKILEDGVCYDPEPEVIRYDFDGNRRYVRELEYFFEQVKNKTTEFDLDLRAGAKVMNLIFNDQFN
jgi:predicted dehydrogenase